MPRSRDPGLRRNEPVVCIFGARGTGKTTWARRLARGAGRVLIFDPLGEWSRSPGIQGCPSIEDLHRRLMPLWHRPRFSLALAVTGDLPRELHRLARLAWLSQEPAGAPPLTLIVDEAQLGYPAQSLPRDLWAMPRAVLQGRHRAIGVVAIAQRPALVSADLRGNAGLTVLFRLPGAVDRRTIARDLGDQLADRCRTLPDHDYLEVAASGAIRPGRNRLGRLTES